MILTINNLGVVKQCQIDLNKKILLFCGKNSTGKTYVSYALHAFLYDDSMFVLDCYKEIARQIRESESFKVTKHDIQAWLDKKCKSVISQSGNIFGISDVTKNKLFKNFSMSAEFSDEDFARILETPFQAMMKEQGENYWKVSKQSSSDIIHIESNVEKNSWLNSSISFVSVMSLIFRRFAFGNSGNARMLTVERNSIYTFKTELSLSRNELIDRIQQQADHSELDIMDMLNSSSRRYPLAVRNSLRVANDLENVQKYDSQYASIADMIEMELLDGEVSMTKNGDVEFHSKRMPKTSRLPFHLSSSIVKTMASLVIYLRHIANVGDTLIVDEPEMNFHPDVQVLLARIFAIMSSRGLKIIVSTHSDYIIRELNNLIMASALIKKHMFDMASKMGYNKEMCVDYNDISVLYFEYSGKKSVKVRPLAVDMDGFSVDSIDSTIFDQNERANALYDELHDENE